MTTTIHILNASPLTERSFGHIASMTESIFKNPVISASAALNVERAFDSSREQYSSSALLAQMLSDGSPNSTKRIAVVDVDLFVPVLTFVFGEAQFRGSVAIVSTHRLHNQYYGLPQNDDLLLQRLEKEIVHELGHIFGLYHCRQFDCVMHSSTYVEEIDLKRLHPCSSCMNALQQPTGS